MVEIDKRKAELKSQRLKKATKRVSEKPLLKSAITARILMGVFGISMTAAGVFMIYINATEAVIGIIVLIAIFSSGTIALAASLLASDKTILYYTNQSLDYL